MRNILTETEKKAVLIETIENLSDRDLINLHNEWCYDNNNYDDEIIEMERFDEICDGMKPIDIATSIAYGGGFNPNDDYFHFNGYGNLESLSDLGSEIYPSDIADDVLRTGKSYECDDIKDLLDEWEESESDDEEEDENNDE